MTVFDIDRNWDRVRTRLHDLNVERAVENVLDTAMASWCMEHCASIPWDSALGPWWYFDGPAGWNPYFPYKWCDRCEEYRKWREQQTKPSTPKPDTPDWYRCWNACRFLAGWNCLIGYCLMPELEWVCIKSDKHSTALGMNAKEPHVLFDILCGHNCSATAILGVTWDQRDKTILTLEEELEKRIEEKCLRMILEKRGNNPTLSPTDTSS